MYCTQNYGFCETCSLVNYGYDCHNHKIKIPPKAISLKRFIRSFFAEKNRYPTWDEAINFFPWTDNELSQNINPDEIIIECVGEFQLLKLRGDND